MGNFETNSLDVCFIVLALLLIFFVTSQRKVKSLHFSGFQFSYGEKKKKGTIKNISSFELWDARIERDNFIQTFILQISKQGCKKVKRYTTELVSDKAI